MKDMREENEGCISLKIIGGVLDTVWLREMLESFMLVVVFNGD